MNKNVKSILMNKKEDGATIKNKNYFFVLVFIRERTESRQMLCTQIEFSRTRDIRYFKTPIVGSDGYIKRCLKN